MVKNAYTFVLEKSANLFQLLSWCKLYRKYNKNPLLFILLRCGMSVQRIEISKKPEF